MVDPPATRQVVHIGLCEGMTRMPTYVYEVINEDGSGGDRFEVVEKMSDDPMTSHPESGEPVRRVFLPTNLNTKGGSKRFTDPDHLAKHGFTRYEKAGDGTYEKTAGDGPDTIQK